MKARRHVSYRGGGEQKTPVTRLVQKVAGRPKPVINDTG